MDQLSLIFDVLGAPVAEEVAHIRGAQARKFLDKLKGRRGVSFSDLLPGTPDDAASLLESLLRFDPPKRCTPREALGHPFFRDLRCVCVRERERVVCRACVLASVVLRLSPACRCMTIVLAG